MGVRFLDAAIGNVLMGKKAVLFDMDGVVFIGDTPISGAGEAVEELRTKGICVLFVTNNATRTREMFVQKLGRMGIEATRDEIMCAAFGVATYLREKYGRKKARAFVVGEKGLFEEIKKAGFEVVNDKKNALADFVVCGLDRKFTYEKAADALYHLKNGAELFGANADATLPTEKGLMPGSGSILAMLEKASGKKAFVVGKPNAYLLEEHLKLHNVEKRDAVFVGDRLDVDIAVANKCGIYSVLVLSGIANAEDAKRAPWEWKPREIIRSAAEIEKVLHRLNWF